MNVLLLGTTGTGKTTIARELCLLLENNVGSNEYWTCLASGDIARALASDKDKEGFKVGKLFADERLMRWKMLNAINTLYYEQNINCIILDGFPRTSEQLEFMFAAEVPIDLAFYIELDFHVVAERIEKRSRDDIDTIQTAMARTTRERGSLLALWHTIMKAGIPCEWINANDRTLQDIVTDIKQSIDMVE
jgi:adenylate kinase family enzyme